MPTITPEELRSQHPKTFEKEYLRWTEYAADYDWADWIKEDFDSQMQVQGIHVDRFTWNISYSQGDGAAFDGHVTVYQWMEANPQYIERYPALYLACKSDGSYMTLRVSNHGFYMHTNMTEYLYETQPEGVFAMLDEEAWVELINDQWASAGLEDEMKSLCERFMQDFYDRLRDEYENITSEDAFVESCECNGVTFETEGEDDHVAA
jgi:hypothetical protein